MSEDKSNQDGAPADPVSQSSQTIVVQNSGRGILGGWFSRLVLVALIGSAIANYYLVQGVNLFPVAAGPLEKFHAGDKDASDKIAVIRVYGTIMPPFTERILKQIKRAKEDESVKGVMLDIDSPGGLVADSHQIYRMLRELSDEKPTYVSMKRMAASGGVYVAMGIGPNGKIFAEPTTWTGSIGVIIPRYDLSKLAERYGVAADSLKTGEFKDSLSPLRELSDRDREVWNAILNESFERFVKIVSDNRPGLDFDTVKNELATGQIFTASQAVENKLIDSIAFEEDVFESLKKEIGLEKVRVVRYWYQAGMLEVLLGSIEAEQPHNRLQAMFDATVPRAMYLCSTAPGLSGVEWIVFER